MQSRREFVTETAAGLLAAAVPLRFPQGQGEGRLTFRPGRPTVTSRPGIQQLNLSTSGRDGVLYVPTGYRPDHRAPFVLWLHGAGGYGSFSRLDWLQAKCDELGIVLLGPDSRDRTWDGALGGFGPDVTYIDRALAHAFARVAVDPARMAIAGFSDGASYALSLGLVNGDLFPKVAAFSPGFIVPAEWHGTPQFFVSHGRQDPILPIDATSRRIVVQLQRGGYRVRFREFDGGHTIPPDIRDEGIRWMIV